MRQAVRVRSVASATLVIADGEFDLRNVLNLNAALRKAFEAGQAIVIDFTDVTFADSTTIGTAVMAYKRAKATGTELRLVLRPQSNVRKVFETAGVTDAIAVCDTMDAALLEVGLRTAAQPLSDNAEESA